MKTKKRYSTDKMIDLAMTKLFQLAEYVCSKTMFKRVESDACISPCDDREQPHLIINCSSVVNEPATPVAAATARKGAPVIRFSKKDYVEGELFT